MEAPEFGLGLLVTRLSSLVGTHGQSKVVFDWGMRGVKSAQSYCRNTTDVALIATDRGCGLTVIDLLADLIKVEHSVVLHNGLSYRHRPHDRVIVRSDRDRASVIPVTRVTDVQLNGDYVVLVTSYIPR